MKKSGLLGSVLAGLSAISLVSAESVAQQMLSGMGSGLKSFFDALYLTPDSTTKVLLGILLYIVIYAVMVKIFKSTTRSGKLFSSIVALIVVLLAFIAMPDGFIGAIVIQYGAMGATVLTLIPFIILLYFSIAVSDSLFIARVVWIWYILYYFSLFAYKIVSLSAENAASAEYVPYGIGIIGGLLVFFALPFIRNLVFKGQLEALGESGDKIVGKAKLLHKLQSRELESSYGDVK